MRARYFRLKKRGGADPRVDTLYRLDCCEIKAFHDHALPKGTVQQKTAACSGELGPLRRIAFHLKIEEGGTGCEKLKKLLQRGNSLGLEFICRCLPASTKPAPDIQLLELRRREVSNTLLHQRCPLEGFVMNDYRHAIAGKPDIKLHSVGSNLNGSLKGGECIFRCNGGGSTVADD